MNPEALRRFVLALALPGAAVGAPSLLIGCAGSVSPPEIRPEPFTSPQVGVDSSGGEQVVLIRAPEPGWMPKLDVVLDGYHCREAYITLRRPNPAMLRAQMMVDQRIATGVGAGTAIKVYVRAVSFDGKAEGAYGLAASADARGQDEAPAR